MPSGRRANVRSMIVCVLLPRFALTTAAGDRAELLRNPVAPDRAGVADLWERLLVRLESMGAAVEPERPGLVCFDARGLLRLHGGTDGVLSAVRRAMRSPARFGVAPSRFAAIAAATRARARRPEIVRGGSDAEGRKRAR